MVQPERLVNVRKRLRHNTTQVNRIATTDGVGNVCVCVCLCLETEHEATMCVKHAPLVLQRVALR